MVRKAAEKVTVRACVAGLALTAILPATLRAQDQPSRIEVGAHVSALALNESNPTGGIGGRVTVRITPRVSIDSRVTLFPADQPSAFLKQGGKSLELLAGARGEFVRKGRFSLYGVLLPGLIHFSNTVTRIAGTSVTYGGATHFALDMGLGVEFHPASRWLAHAELTGPVFAVRGTLEP